MTSDCLREVDRPAVSDSSPTAPFPPLSSIDRNAESVVSGDSGSGSGERKVSYGA